MKGISACHVAVIVAAYSLEKNYICQTQWTRLSTNCPHWCFLLYWATSLCKKQRDKHWCNTNLQWSGHQYILSWGIHAKHMEHCEEQVWRMLNSVEIIHEKSCFKSISLFLILCGRNHQIFLAADLSVWSFQVLPNPLFSYSVRNGERKLAYAVHLFCYICLQFPWA